MTDEKIQWSRQEDVVLTWVHKGQEFSHRLITKKLHGSSMSFHITTYMPHFDVMVEGELLPLTAEEGFATRDELAERYAEKTGRTMENFAFYHVMALWKMAIILEGLYVHYKTGTASNPAAAEFEFRVPRLVERAQLQMARG